MAFTLVGAPPAKSAKPTAENVAALDAWLGSIIAFRALTSDKPWTFYEQMEVYLGPWGASGYPVGYGIKYCKIFFLDEVLRESPAGQAWVHRTLILLQQALKDFVLKRFRAGTLASVSAAEFKQAAFDSHPLAYTEGGLSMVVMLNPLLTLYVASLPAAEFNPLGKNFVPTIKQVVLTSAISVPQCMAILGMSSAPFAHAGILGRAYANDRATLNETMYIGGRLAEAREAVRSGAADNVAFLDLMRRSILQLQLPDRSLAALAQDLLSTIEARRAYLRTRYAREVQIDPSLADVYGKFDRLVGP